MDGLLLRMEWRHLSIVTTATVATSTQTPTRGTRTTPPHKGNCSTAPPWACRGREALSPVPRTITSHVKVSSGLPKEPGDESGLISGLYRLEAPDASLLVAFANTARQIMTADLPARCFLNRARSSNSDVSKRFSAEPMITGLVWMSASILYNTEVRAQIRANCGGW